MEGNSIWPAGPNSQQPGGVVCPGQQPNQACWPGPQPGQQNPPSWPGQQPNQPNSTPWPGPQPSQPNPPSWPGPQPAGQLNPPSWPGQQLSQPNPPSWPGQQLSQPNPPSWPGQPPNQPTAPSWPEQQPGQPGQPAQPCCPGQPNPFNTPRWIGHPGQSLWPGQPGGQQTRDPGQPGWPGQNPPYIPPWPGPPSGLLTVPFNLDLPSGVYDKLLITINGQVQINANMFTVDFLRGKDIAFHINPRFNEGGKQVIVRNHKVGGRWGKEERVTQAQFPFMQGLNFEMKILCTVSEFKVAVNNAQVLVFKHRVQELAQINELSIYNDIILNSVRAETLP